MKRGLPPNPLPYFRIVREIQTMDDVRTLVERFYAHAIKDEVIGHFFAHLALNVHLPKITSFWCMVLLGWAIPPTRADRLQRT